MTTHSSILAWENPKDRGVWKSMVHGVAKESDTIQHLNTTTNIFPKASCQLQNKTDSVYLRSEVSEAQSQAFPSQWGH